MSQKSSRVDSIGLGVRLLTRFAGHPMSHRLGLHRPASALIKSGARVGFAAASGAGRQFKALRQLTSPSRGERPASNPELFDLTPNDEQQMIVETMEQVAAELLRPNAEAAEADCAPSAELVAQANELGVLAMSIPEGLGGAMTERSPVTGMLIAEALAHGDMGLAVSLLATPSVALLLADYGSAAQQDAFLAPMTDDDAPTASFAVTEARALFSPYDLATRVESRDGGLVLSGEKALVVNGVSSDFFVVAARSPEGAPGLYIVEAAAEGVSVEAEPAMGLRAAGLSRLRFDKVCLREDAASVLGEGDYDRIIAASRAAWCALAVGTATAVRDYVIPYANERKAFGEPISHRQSVAFMISNIGIERDGLRLALLRAASRMERGEDALREVQLARTLAARHAMQIGSDGVQIFGGHGFVKEYPVERWYRDLRATALMEGAVLI